MGLFRRREEGDGGRVDWLIVGLGNPGDKHAGTRHNVGFDVVALAAQRWDLPKAKKRWAGLYTEGRTGPGDITLYESHGMGVQDLYVGSKMLELARARNVGVDLPIGD